MTQDTFKKVYTEMPENIKKDIYNMKTQAENLEAYFNFIDNHDMQIAKQHLRTALMWATRAYVHEGDNINAFNKQKENSSF